MPGVYMKEKSSTSVVTVEVRISNRKTIRVEMISYKTSDYDRCQPFARYSLGPHKTNSIMLA